VAGWSWRKQVFSAVSVTLACLLGACTTLPTPRDTTLTRALPAPQHGLLAQTAAALQDGRAPNALSAFLLLDDNREALHWRLALIDHAQSSIDLQYFIWDNDVAGTILLDRVLRAAQRGVRVRLLVDDILLAKSDRSIASISRHPNIEIRIFNPGRIRESRLGAAGEFILNFRSLNRRMHNKLLVADNSFAIVGGRNVGDAYFGLGRKFNFIDLDVMVTGAVVGEISEAFDDYWNADLAFPGESMSRRVNPNEIVALRAAYPLFLAAHCDVEASESLPVYPRDWTERFAALPDRMVRGLAHFVQDEPVGYGKDRFRLSDIMVRMAMPSHSDLIIVTPYLIPETEFLRNLRKLISEGVRVRILTASLASNNHTIAHSHYKKYRRELLQAGVELYEFKHRPSATVQDQIHARGRSDASDAFAAMHIKAVVGDRSECFIGSLNLDPRGAHINTENGLYIQSTELSEQLADKFESLMSVDNAWRVRIDAHGRVYWSSREGSHYQQPARSTPQRIKDFLYRFIPIESQL